MEKQHFLYGASGHAKVIIDTLSASNIKIQAIVDDNPIHSAISNIPVVHTKKFVINSEHRFIVSIGNNAIRKKIVNQNSFQFYRAVDLSATVSEFAYIEEGTVVMPNAVINSGAKIGKHCIINSASVIEHDCIVADYVHISPNVALAGNVSVGEGTHIGIGACVIQGVKIGKWSIIGAGAVIINDIPDNAVVAGNPGRIIKFNAHHA
jgi:sugar O-acyltransferase (sialic acid O-acetyltransferase NeuD family)